MEYGNTFYLIKEEKNRQANLLQIFKEDFDRLELKLEFQNLIYSNYLCNEINEKIDVMLSNLRKLVDEDFNETIVNCYLFDIYFEIINCAFLNFKDFFSQLYHIADCILSNTKIPNPMDEYFNNLFFKIANDFNIKQPYQIEYITLYENFNLSEEKKWLAIQIYNELWDLFVTNENSTEIEKINLEHSQAIIDMSNNLNKRPLNQTTKDIKRFIEYIEIIIKSQLESDEFIKSLAILRVDNIQQIAEHTQNKTEKEIKTIVETKNIERNVTQKNQKKKPISKFILIPLVLCIMFFISIFDMPYGFYTFARITVFALSILFLYIWYSKIEEFNAGFIPVIIIAILWNPIIPIHLDKDTWAHFDLFAAIIEIIIGILAYHTTKKK